mmetsp:Transcript_267/g.481  ORF Transcript_267/g.481 Transcript_267/m.481 type:complete len:205 (-) Transcript_267:4717-5331(-)
MLPGDSHSVGRKDLYGNEGSAKDFGNTYQSLDEAHAHDCHTVYRHWILSNFHRVPQRTVTTDSVQPIHFSSHRGTYDPSNRHNETPHTAKHDSVLYVYENSLGADPESLHYLKSLRDCDVLCPSNCVLLPQLKHHHSTSVVSSAVRRVAECRDLHCCCHRLCHTTHLQEHWDFLKEVNILHLHLHLQSIDGRVAHSLWCHYVHG